MTTYESFDEKSVYVIEKGIPLPSKRYKWKSLFDKLSTGDSFLVPNEKEYGSVTAGLSSYGAKTRRHKNEDGTIRIWVISKGDIK